MNVKKLIKCYANNETILLNNYLQGRIPKARLITQLEMNKKCYIAQVLNESITYANIKNNYKMLNDYKISYIIHHFKY